MYLYIYFLYPLSLISPLTTLLFKLFFLVLRCVCIGQLCWSSNHPTYISHLFLSRCQVVCQKSAKSATTIKLTMPEGDVKSFEFDQIFTGSSEGDGNSQLDVFRDTKHLVMSVVDGYNVCIFAYGQTGSGKTFTMIGGAEISSSVQENGNIHPDAGIAPRAVVELFRLLNERAEQVIICLALDTFFFLLFLLFSLSIQKSQYCVALDSSSRNT